MSLTPHSVEQQVFRERRRGYDPEEVDRFLDEVSASLAELIGERDRANARVAELENATKETRESQALLQRTLLSAERTAEQTVADAREEAETLLEQARRDAAELLETAEAEAAELRRAAGEEVAELRSRAHADLASEQEQARTGAAAVRRAVAELRDFRDEYRERVQAVITEQLAALDRVGELPDLDPAIEELAALPADDGATEPHGQDLG